MRGRRLTVGILADHITNEYQNTILFGASDELREAGATAIYFAGGIIDSPDPRSAQRNAIYELIDPERIDGLILLSPVANHIGAAALAAYCARFAPIPICVLSMEMPGASSVQVDDVAGMRALLHHLVHVHGKRRIAFVRGPESNVEAERRYRVYREVLERADIALDPDLVAVGDFHGESAVEAVRLFCDERRAPFDALVGANDLMALGAMQALEARGYDVPGQIAIGGFDDVEEARFATPPLTTVRQPLYDSGRRASQLLHARLRREGRDESDGPEGGALLGREERAVLETQLVLRESCGCIADEPFVQRAREPSRTACLADFLDERRAGIVADLARAVPAEHARIAPDWPDPLLGAFLDDLRGTSGTTFVPLLSATLRRVAAAGGSVRAWHAVVGVLHDAAGAATGDAAAARRADELLHRARILIGDLRERLQAQHRMRRERSVRTLYETSEALMTAFDVGALVAAISEQLPRLEIPACAISLYGAVAGGGGGAGAGDGAAGDRTFARPLFVQDARQPIDTESGAFPAWALAPPGWIDARQRTLIVQPLAFRGEALGFGAFEMGPEEGVVYEGLRDLVSAAIKGARLVEKVVEEEKRRQRAERERLEEEMEIAARIQTSIVPRTIRVPGLDVAAAMIPATEVGGDYYDVLPFEGGCWIGVGDVAGHGLKTGLVMLMIQSVVAAIVRCDPRAAPSRVVRMLNAVLFENIRRRLGQDEHATLSLFRYDGGDGRFVFAGAHEEIVIHRAARGGCERLPTPGPWVGAVPNLGASLVDSELTLAPADVMVLYTDGVTEAMDAAGAQFGIDRLCEAIDGAQGLRAEGIRDQVLAAVRRWTAKQFDDVSIVVVRRPSGEG
jgi:sigma-B regulation protein RsbU (phosphoserine phosphatase)